MSDRRRNRDLRREINDPMQDWPINGVGGQDVALPPGTVRTRGDLINVIGGDGPAVEVSAVLTAGAGDLINVTGGDAPTIDLAVDITAGAGDLINVTGGGAPTINIEGGVAAGAGALINVTGGGAPAVDIPALITAGAGDLINVTGGAAPTVTAGQDLNVVAGAGDLINITGGEFPVVDITGNVTAGAGDLINVTGGDAPTVTAGSSDAYIVNSFAPPVVADFAGVLNSGTPYFRVGGSDSSFASMFTFARSSTAYYRASDGTLTQASSGTARKDHYKWNGSSWVRAGILLESEARTNAVVESHITTANWAVGGGTAITDNNATWIDGNTSAALITADSTGTDAQFFRKSLVGLRSNSSNNVQYIYVRNGTADYVYLSMNRRANSNANEYVTAVFDLTGSNTSASQTSVGSTSGTLGATHQERVSADWWRITLVGYIGRTSSDLECGFAEAATGNSFDTYGGCTHSTGWGSETFYANGAQAEGSASTPSSYIPTSGATVTRAAEELLLNTSGHPINGTDFSWHIKGTLNYQTNNNEVFSIQNNTSNYTLARFATDGDLDVFNFTSAGDSNDETTTFAAVNLSAGDVFDYSIASRVDSGVEANAALNGTAGTAGSYGTTPNFTSATAYLDGRPFNRPPMHNVKLLRIWPTADIGDTGIESATS